MGFVDRENSVWRHQLTRLIGSLNVYLRVSKIIVINNNNNNNLYECELLQSFNQFELGSLKYKTSCCHVPFNFYYHHIFLFTLIST